MPLDELKKKIPQLTVALLQGPGKFDISEDGQFRVTRSEEPAPRRGGGQDAPGPTDDRWADWKRSRREWGKDTEWNRWSKGDGSPTEEEKIQLKTYVIGRKLTEGLYTPAGRVSQDVVCQRIKCVQNYCHFAKKQWQNSTKSFQPWGQQNVFDPYKHTPEDCARFLMQMSRGCFYTDAGVEVPPPPPHRPQSAGSASRGKGGPQGSPASGANALALACVSGKGGGKQFGMPPHPSWGMAPWYFPSPGHAPAPWYPGPPSYVDDTGGGQWGSVRTPSPEGCPLSDFRDDDWWCQACNTRVFKRNLKCFRCKGVARPGAGDEFGLPEGTWCVQ